MTQPPRPNAEHASDLVITHVRLLTGELTNIVIDNGKILAITPEPPVRHQRTFDAGGRVAIPALIDVHVHLDKTLTAKRPGFENETGELEEAIHRWQMMAAQLSHEDYCHRARQALMMAQSHGSYALRSHLDVSPQTGLRSVEALLQLKDEVKDQVRLELVALGLAGVDRQTDQLLRDALELGIDVVGGCPWLSPHPEKAIRFAFKLAERYGRPLDLHVDETEDASVRTLEAIAEHTVAHGMQGQVNVGHCVSLGAMPDHEAKRIIDNVAAARISVTTLPSVNLTLQGRGQTSTRYRGLTRVKELLGAGVRVCAASDNVQDPFNPLGSYNLLWIANLLAHAAHLTSPQEQRQVLELISAAPAEVMGLSPGITIGAPATLSIVDHTEPETLFAVMPPVYARAVHGELSMVDRGNPGPLGQQERTGGYHA